MFSLVIIIGIYTYLILILGIIGILYKIPILIVTVLTVFLSIIYLRRENKKLLIFSLANIKKNPLIIFFIAIVFVNLIGAFGPELAFDALWYHLTLPKIYLQNHTINFISGGLFYYSAMPKLGEMLYVFGLSFGSEILPKLIHFSFGVLASLVIYKITRKFLDEKYSFIAVLIFYGSLVVAWESTTAYIDLIRTFFEAMVLWGFVNWHETKDIKWLIKSAVMLGLAISTKLLALGSLLIFAALIVFSFKNINKNTRTISTNILVYWCVTMLIALPWFLFAFINTGNPFYPIFSDLYPVGLSWSSLNPVNLVRDLITLFFRADDPISPIFAIVLPLSFIMFQKFSGQKKIIALYSLLALVVWYFTPRSGGGRFILPYLPAFSILSAMIISDIRNQGLKKYLIGLVIFVCLTTIVYRGVANAKFIPVILGLQTKQDFLTKNLNFNFGDFYDVDGYFKKNIKPDDKILLYGFHNLYYADFPFIHESYVKKGDKFKYIATQNAILPERFSYWSLVYQNEINHVKVYSLGGKSWNY